MRIVILGGGISGLSLAWFLQERFKNKAKITIIEKSTRLGGLIKTEKAGGFLFEQGPHSCRPFGNGSVTVELIQALGLSKEVIQANSAAHTRYIYGKKKLWEIPNNLLKLMRDTSSWRYLLSLFKEPFISSLKNQQEETIKQFFKRRLGSSITENLVDPFVTGIFAGNIDELSLKSCFPQLHQWEREYGSIIKGALLSKKKKTSDDPFFKQLKKGKLFSLRGGLQTLVEAFKDQFQGELQLSCSASSLHFEKRGIRITTNCNEVEADYLFSTIPADAVAPLLEPHDTACSNYLLSISRAPIAVVNMGYKSSVLNKKGFGYLIPSSEKERVLGVVWDSSAFPEQNCNPNETRVTVMIGGMRLKNFSDYSVKDFSEMALEVMERHLGIKKIPDVMVCHITEKAIPQYTVGHQGRVDAIEKSITKLSPNFAVLGNCFYGISINDCIAKAKEIAYSHHFENL